MQVLNVAATAAAAAAATPSDPSTGGASTNPTDKLTNETTFLQLLVSQIKNQDPLNPADSTQFIGQLVQFSQLEQLLGINQGVKNLNAKAPTPPATPPVTLPANTPTPVSTTEQI